MAAHRRCSPRYAVVPVTAPGLPIHSASCERRLYETRQHLAACLVVFLEDVARRIEIAATHGIAEPAVDPRRPRVVGKRRQRGLGALVRCPAPPSRRSSVLTRPRSWKRRSASTRSIYLARDSARVGAESVRNWRIVPLRLGRVAFGVADRIQSKSCAWQGSLASGQSC